MLAIHEDTFRRAMKAGVKIAFGTDAGGFDWKVNPAKEFGYMVKWGMTPAQAMHASTTSAAELLGMQDKVGTIEAGKLADLTVLSADLMKIPAPEILRTRCLMTIVGGEIAFEAESR
jgi:imidazolonepropionase-like amidohydrolase